MLCELSIKNFAIIDDLKIRFADGLTILTGETGAGKSIIINAINLLLGAKAASRMVRKGAEAAELEAFFELDPKSTAFCLMKEKGYDPGEGLLVKRIIAANDRHRTYINGGIATMQILTAITENLVSISGQHAHQGLFKEESHLLILDQYGKLLTLREQVKTGYQKLHPLIEKQCLLEARKKKQTEQTQLLSFQKEEILSAEIKEGEDEALETEKSRLKHGEFLFQTVEAGIESLYRGESSVFEKMSEIKKMIDRAREIDPTLEAQAASLEEMVYRVEDMADAFRRYTEGIQMDPARLEEVLSRIDFLNRLKRKYAGPSGTLEEVASKYEEICKQLESFENISDEIEAVKKEIARSHQNLSVLAKDLSNKRKEAARTLSGKVEQALAALEMKNTRFQVDVQDIISDKSPPLSLQVEGRFLTENGLDTVRFMIAPNVGEEIKPLSAIASGGELSRVVLALKSILAENDDVATIVFDEVDAGIGGGIAEVVGRKISELSRFHQVLCITHLPQIARFGTHHYKISKQVANGRTISLIRPLDKNERIDEIARMLGGIEITETTLAHAREILKNTA